MILLTYLYFLIIIVAGWRFLHTKHAFISHPIDRRFQIQCTGNELFLILTFATGAIGLLTVLSLRLAFLELFCIIALVHSKRKISLSFPLTLYIVFLLWLLIGMIYAPSVEYSIRMILKYIYPFILALLTYSVVRNHNVFLKSCLLARKVATLSIIIFTVPFLSYLFMGVFWNRAAMATHYITICIFSLGMYFTFRNIKDLYYALIFALPCLIWVFRTDIMGTGIAFSSFFLIKYKLKALPIIIATAVLSVCSLFYIPSVKAKMFFEPDKVTLTDYLSGNVDENNFNTNGRKLTWQDCIDNIYTHNELTGAGTGRVQYQFYEVYTGWKRGGQLHNDFLVLLCDNGIIGVILYALTTFAIFTHCLLIYNRKKSNAFVKLCSITAGASILGVTATMYSDNTISYSMATLAYPWGFYGMALGLSKEQRND